VATYLAAFMIVAAVALFVAAPLTEGVRRRRHTSTDELEIERFRHAQALAMQGLRELEFDHEMGKLDVADYQRLRATLEHRALAAMSALDRARPQDSAPPSSAAPSPPGGPSPRTLAGSNFCPQCGARRAPAAGFCSECGVALASGAPVATRFQ
jgi:cytochrome c-type biogenesis protein CcmI